MKSGENLVKFVECSQIYPNFPLNFLYFPKMSLNFPWFSLDVLKIPSYMSPLGAFAGARYAGCEVFMANMFGQWTQHPPIRVHA